MSEPKPEQEPSMEEILASIRRIISEDDEQDGAQAEAEKPEAAEPDDQGEGAEVLDLTEIVEERGEAPEAKEPADSISDDDLDALLNQDDVGEIEFIDEDDDENPALIEPVSEPEPVIAEPVAAKADLTSDILEETTTQAATGSLSSLVAAVDQARGATPLGDGNRTVEDLVKEVMRPMVKEWLDENLPNVVERLVRREIERLARNAEGEE